MLSCFIEENATFSKHTAHYCTMVHHWYACNARQVWDALEVAGGALLRCLRYGAGLSMAAFDIADWDGYCLCRGIPGQRNPLDMAPAGMAFLVSKLISPSRLFIHPLGL